MIVILAKNFSLNTRENTHRKGEKSGAQRLMEDLNSLCMENSARKIK